MPDVCKQAGLPKVCATNLVSTPRTYKHPAAGGWGLLRGAACCCLKCFTALKDDVKVLSPVPSLLICCRECFVRGGGIEPLHVSMPRELKSRPNSSPTHPGLMKCNSDFFGVGTGPICHGLYSSVVERQSCKLKVRGSIPSGGCLLRCHGASCAGFTALRMYRTKQGKL